jgi:hypothetical protein
VSGERDPLADLVSRSVGRRIESVAVEALPTREGIERKRLRYESSAGPAAAIFERSPRGEALEAQLLPFLARKTDRVPIVHARGIPPAHVTLGPWVLIEDVFDAPLACDGDVRDIVRAKLAIERAVAKDLPALHALGVGEYPRVISSLASAPRGLMHGDLSCPNARRAARGVVLTSWGRAAIGPAVIDAAHFARELEREGRHADAEAVRDTWIGEVGVPGAATLWSAAQRALN